MATVHKFSAIRRIPLLGKPLGGSVLHETAVQTFIFSLCVELCHNWPILAVEIYFFEEPGPYHFARSLCTWDSTESVIRHTRSIMYVTVLLHGAFYAECLLQSFGRHFSPPCCMLCKIIAGEQSLLNRKHFLTSPDLRMRHNIRQGDRLTKKRRDLLWLVEPVFP